MQERPIHERWVDDRQVKRQASLVLLDEVPCGTLRQHLARAVHSYWRGILALRLAFLSCSGVPDRFVISLGAGRVVQDSCDGGGDDDALHLCAVLACTFEDGERASDSRLDELVGIGRLEMERGRGVFDRVDTFDRLVKRAVLSTSEEIFVNR